MIHFKRHNTELEALTMPFLQNTSPGTSATLHSPTGRFIIAEGESNFTVTNSFVGANSVIIPVPENATGPAIKCCEKSTGQFTVTTDGTAPNGGLAIGFVIFNPNPSAQISTGEGMDDAFDSEKEFVITTGPVGIGGKLLAGSGDEEGADGRKVFVTKYSGDPYSEDVTGTVVVTLGGDITCESLTES